MSRLLLPLLLVVVALALPVLSLPQSYPPPAGTTIEPARVNPPFWQDNVACNVDSRIPRYAAHYNLNALGLNTSIIYRLAEADVTGPMNDAVVAAFLSHWPDVNITTYRYGSGSVGLCLAGKQTTNPANNHPYCDMAVVSREIAPVQTSSTELANFISKLGYQPMEVPVNSGSYNALGFEDAMIFYVNGANPLKHITLAQLDAIISTTRNRGYPHPILTWDQLGVRDPEFHGQPIKVYGSTVGNGFDVFINRVVMQNGTWNTANLNQSSTVFPIGSLVTADKFGLGFSGVSYINQTGITVNVRVLKIAWEEGCKPVAVSQATLCSREWPLSRIVYFYANLPPSQASLDPVIYEYLNFLLSYEGQNAMRHAQGGVYFPLSYDVLTETRARFLVIRHPPAFVDSTGSLYFNHSSFCRPDDGHDGDGDGDGHGDGNGNGSGDGNGNGDGNGGSGWGWP
jgi:phosphate transport system substrate-binding protein